MADFPYPPAATPADRVMRALACSALGPGLNGVLLFDLPPEMITPVADVFEHLLSQGCGGPVERTVLGAVTGDDELWARYELTAGDGAVTFHTAPGPLLDVRDAGTGLVVVPDLARLSVAGMRAAVQVLGSDVAVAERSGVSARWRPQARWLAVCRADDVGRISPHLLDRFPVRLSAATPAPRTTTGERVLAALQEEPSSMEFGRLPAQWLEVLARPGPVPTGLSEDAVRRVLDLLGPGAEPRRALALARIARNLAAFQCSETGDVRHADAAAQLIGLIAARPLGGPEPGSEPDSGAGDEPGLLGVTEHNRELTNELLPQTPRLPLYEPGPATQLDGFPAGEPHGLPTPYPEDDAEPLREAMALRMPGRARPGPHSRGVVTGVRKATGLRDLAFVATVMEAAKHQKLAGRRLRRTQAGDGRLVISPADLRGYARAPEADRMLVLLLDHTCRGDWDWRPALAPYRIWAYTTRAAVCVIEVGSADSDSDLRASHFTTRNVLDPRVDPALRRKAGRSSPLAHGLATAEQVLRRAFQQRSRVTEAWLVVASDGRGNVPLAASLTDRLSGPVGRTGVEDAMSAARRIRSMGNMRLHAVLLDPATKPYGDLPSALADALGGILTTMRDGEG